MTMGAVYLWRAGGWMAVMVCLRLLQPLAKGEEELDSHLCHMYAKMEITK